MCRTKLNPIVLLKNPHPLIILFVKWRTFKFEKYPDSVAILQEHLLKFSKTSQKIGFLIKLR